MLELGQVDKASDTPAFKQIAGALRESIGAGRIGPGEKVPSEARLMEHFGVARMTVRQAFEWSDQIRGFRQPGAHPPSAKTRRPAVRPRKRSSG